MKRITAVLRDDKSAQNWLDYLSLNDVVELKVEALPDATTNGETPPKKVRATNKTPHREPGTSLYRMLEAEFGVGNPFKIEAATKFAKKQGYAEPTASSTLSTLKRDQLVDQRAEDGLYYFLKAVPKDYVMKNR